MCVYLCILDWSELRGRRVECVNPVIGGGRLGYMDGLGLVLVCIYSHNGIAFLLENLTFKPLFIT